MGACQHGIPIPLGPLKTYVGIIQEEDYRDPVNNQHITIILRNSSVTGACGKVGWSAWDLPAFAHGIQTGLKQHWRVSQNSGPTFWQSRELGIRIVVYWDTPLQLTLASSLLRTFEEKADVLAPVAPRKIVFAKLPSLLQHPQHLSSCVHAARRHSTKPNLQKFQAWRHPRLT